MPALLWSIAGWFLREVLVKFIVLAAVFALVAMFLPMAFGYLAPFIKPGALSDAFSAIPSGVWWLIDYFRLDYGLPLLISAHVARFLIRRLPVVG